MERKKRKRERLASAEAITEDEDLAELLAKLTPKQKEQLDAQLRQEQEIRTRMLSVTWPFQVFYIVRNRI